MKLRSLFSILAVSVLGILLIGAVGFNWFTTRSPLASLGSKPDASPAAAMFVSKQAPVMASLLVNPDRLEVLSQGIPNSGERRQAKAELEQLKQSLLLSPDLDYKRDVQPWIGDEITWAVTSADFDRDRQTGQQPGYLLAIATKDPERSREFLQLFWQKRAASGTDLAFEQYKGVKLIYSNIKAGNSSDQNQQKNRFASSTHSSNTAPSLASAVVGDRFVLFANHPKVLRDAINNVQAVELSLSNSSQYQRSLESFKPGQAGLIFVNLPALTNWGRSQSVLPNAELDADQAGPYESLAIAIDLNRKGLLAKTALVSVPGQEAESAPASLSRPVEALQYLPETTALAAAGRDLEQLWAKLSAGLAEYGSLAQLVQQPLAELQASWHVDFAQDVFSWVKGDYALGLLPRPDRDRPDWIFVAERTPETVNGLDHLDAIAKQQGFSAGPLSLEDQQVFAWTKLTPAKAGANQDLKVLEAQVQGIHATVDNYELFTTSVEAMDEALKATRQSLAANANFKQAIAALPDENNGYFYLNWVQSQALLERQLPLLKLVEIAAQPLLGHVRSLIITSEGSEAGIRRGDVFIELGQSS